MKTFLSLVESDKNFKHIILQKWANGNGRKLVLSLGRVRCLQAHYPFLELGIAVRSATNNTC